MPNTPVLLAIMDGLGWEEPGPANAVGLASTPCLDGLVARYPFTTLGASGPDVGLPEGQMGNSEVGHLNIGAGRVVMQELMRINHAVDTGEIYDNPVLGAAMDDVAARGTTLHLMGLLSTGGVHSSFEHCAALVRMAARRNVRHLRVHAFLDGRDVAPGTGEGFVEELASLLANVSEQSGLLDARVGSVSGRYYAMDRDNRWERVQRAWEAIVLGRGTEVAAPVQGVRASYERGVTDEFVVPFVCDEPGVQDGDAAVYFNFRPDRARELTRAFTEPSFDGFNRGRVPSLAAFVTMTEYDPQFHVQVAFPKTAPQNVLADVLAAHGLRQLHTAETEKYAHVTFFINGGVEAAKEGEERVLVASPKVATYDLQPEMSAPEVAEKLAAAIEADEADVYVVNFANPDMVGHTGVLEAAVAAVEATDAALARVLEALAAKGGQALVTADHGNADCMFTVGPDGERKPMTAHTCARVPFVVVADGYEIAPGEPGRLCDVAPTLLDLVGIAKPEEWTGRSLIKRREA